MKKFICKSAVFAIVTIVTIVISTFIAYKYESSLLRRNLICDPEIKIAAVGDSLVATAFDDEGVKFLRNFGVPGDNFFSIIKRARMIADLNPNLELMVLAFSPDRFLTHDVEKPIPLCSKWLLPHTIVVELMFHEDMPPVSSDIFIGMIGGILRPATRHVFERMPKSPMAGGHFAAEHQMTAEEWSAESANSTNVICEDELKPDGERMLDELLGHLRRRKLKTVIIGMPMSKPGWQTRYSSFVRGYYLRKMEALALKNGAVWYNWIGEYSDDISMWADAIHLNKHGAKVFMREKFRLLEQNIKGK